MKIYNISLYYCFLKLFVLIQSIYLIVLSKQIYKHVINEETKTILNQKLSFSEFANNILNIPQYFFNITNLEYSFSFKFNTVEIKYAIIVYDNKNNIIKPSNFALLDDLHFFCFIKHLNNNSFIYSFVNITNNSNINCIEYITIKEKAIFGINIYKNRNENNDIYFFSNNFIKYNNIINKDDQKFDYLKQINESSRFLINKTNSFKLKTSIVNSLLFSFKS